MKKTLAGFLLVFLTGMLSAHAADVPSDTEITRRVKASLNATIGVRARAIDIVVLDGVVTLNGRVATNAAREAAANATERAIGVRAVSNNLSVGARQ